MFALNQIDGWGADHAAVAISTPDGVVATHGDTTRQFRIASVAKLLTAYAAMIAVEEGTVSLDDGAGPQGATLRHLLAHSAGYGFDSDAGAIARPATRRIYSNRGIEEAAAHVAQAAAMPFGQYLREAVFEPLQMPSTELRTSPAFGVWSTTADLTRFVAELFAPRLISVESLAEMTNVQFPGLRGVLPGIGRMDELDFGLGFERNFAKPGHWAGSRVSASTFGHFGGAGTFVWLDPVARAGCVCLTDREFDAWARDAWPPFCDGVIDTFGSAGHG